MNQDLIRKNAAYYRKSKNMTLQQAAYIAGLEKEDYEKMELGFFDFTYDALSNLATFYGIDITAFNEEHVVEDDNKNERASHKQSVVTSEEVAAQSKFPWLSVVGLALSALLLIWFLFFKIELGSVTIGNLQGTVSYHHYELFNTENAKYIIIAITLILVPLWHLVSDIIFVSSSKLRRGAFAKATKILNVALSITIFIFTIVISVDLRGRDVFYPIFTAALLVIDLIQTILFFKKRDQSTSVEEKSYAEKRRMNYVGFANATKGVKIVTIIGLCASIVTTLLFAISFAFGAERNGAPGSAVFKGILLVATFLLGEIVTGFTLFRKRMTKMANIIGLLGLLLPTLVFIVIGVIFREYLYVDAGIFLSMMFAYAITLLAYIAMFVLSKFAQVNAPEEK